MNLPVIGQAVVTDPSTGRGGGYILVAASPGVDPEDARHLSAAPQVTDHLHLAASPGPYYSFYRLPSGRWAAVKRFVRGTRRREYNRVVVHTLTVPPEALHRLAEEPWLLWTHCRFRPRGEEGKKTPGDLTDRAGEPGLERLPDLELLPLDDARGARRALLEQRRDFLLRRGGDGERLDARLRTVRAAREAGRRVLLPQGAEGEQLLTLAWSSMPAEDRLATCWTTHLAPGAGELFHLACCPDPAGWRRAQEAPERWVLAWDEEVPAAAEPPRREREDPERAKPATAPRRPKKTSTEALGRFFDDLR